MEETTATNRSQCGILSLYLIIFPFEGGGVNKDETNAVDERFIEEEEKRIDRDRRHSSAS